MISDATIEPDFAIDVICIAVAWIHAVLRAGPHHLQFSMDPQTTPGPEELACWMLALTKGEAAALTFGWGEGSPTLSGIPMPDNLIRLSGSRRLAGGVAEKIFDCVVSIDQANSGVRAFLRAVEQHPNLASGWLYWDILPEAIALEIEAEIRSLEEAAAGRLPELPYDLCARDVFEAAYVAERMQFTPEEQEYIDGYRAQLVAAADRLA